MGRGQGGALFSAAPFRWGIQASRSALLCHWVLCHQVCSPVATASCIIKPLRPSCPSGGGGGVGARGPLGWASPCPGRRGLQREARLASGPRSSLSGARGGVREAESLPRALWGPGTAGAAWPTRTRLRRRPAPVLLGAVASLPALLGLNVRVTSLAHGFSEFSLPGCFQQTLTERLMPQALC